MRNLLIPLLLLALFAGCQQANQGAQQNKSAPEIAAYLKASDEEYSRFHRALLKVMEAIPAIESTDEPPNKEQSEPIVEAVKVFTQTCKDYQTSIEQRPTPSPAKMMKELELKRLSLIRESVALEFKRLYVDNPHHKDYFAARKTIDGVGSQTQEALLGQRSWLMTEAGLTVPQPSASPG